MAARIGEQSRATKETAIKAKVNLDGSGTYNVSTGIGFLDHMMEQLSRHSLIDIDLEAKGDLHIDFTTPLRIPALCWARRCAPRWAILKV